jgi:hypothetical protein
MDYVRSYLVLAEPPQPHHLGLQLPYFVLQALLLALNRYNDDTSQSER